MKNFVILIKKKIVRFEWKIYKSLCMM